MTELYISFDIETDGRYFPTYSMLSIGAVLCAVRREGKPIEALAREDWQTFYAEMQPRTPHWEQAAMDVNGLNRIRLMGEAQSPFAVMSDFADWALFPYYDGPIRPVAVAWPATFDWPFLTGYLNLYVEHKNPFSFSGCLDLKTMYHVLAGTPWGEATKSHMPEALQTDLPKTHHALDDAKAQADLFLRMLAWDGEMAR